MGLVQVSNTIPGTPQVYGNQDRPAKLIIHATNHRHCGSFMSHVALWLIDLPTDSAVQGIALLPCAAATLRVCPILTFLATVQVSSLLKDAHLCMYYEVKLTLPLGRHLWPSIFCTGSIFSTPSLSCSYVVPLASALWGFEEVPMGRKEVNLESPNCLN